tara:strand:- start:36 stop:1370 length:1335 start_codon:yes stop_codon:yes gene_type:complete
MYNTADNIVALATLAGKSALNIVRVSGTNSTKIYKQLTKTTTLPKPNLCLPKSIYSLTGDRPLDHCMIIYYKSPKSFTGENSIEIIVHGGVIIVNKLIETIVAMGSRVASPGEFSYRAYINNKIDLIQAEAIASIITAQNSVDSFYYLNAIKGNLSKEIINYNKKINNIITIGEHELNFSDEEITKKQSQEYILFIKKIKKDINTLIGSCYTLESDLSTLRVAIVGKPNAGKSSLFNSLVGKSRSIVTNQKGTTRDTIEADIYIGDILIKLIDTAGLRASTNKVEKIGITRSYKEIDTAQIVIIIDDQNPKKIKELLGIKNKNILLVNNKSDLKTEQGNTGLPISCKNNVGIDQLSTKLLTLCKSLENNFFTSFTYLINQRQITLLSNISKGLEGAILDYEQTLDITILISSLYSVQDTFNSLIRPNDRDEILNNIFKGFCIGK